MKKNPKFTQHFARLSVLYRKQQLKPGKGYKINAFRTVSEIDRQTVYQTTET